MNRADFIPDVVWTTGPDGWRIPVNRHEDPDRWQALTSTTGAIITQVDDGHLRDGKGFQPTSSSSALSAMDHMLDLLDASADINVLEIGTGTGYNAALIAQKIAPGHLTTIEVDPEIADHARAALARNELPVTVITADGTHGHADNAPYDRTISTASALRIPYAWVEQTRPGGKIVLPLVGSFNRQAFVRLTVDDGGDAQGRFLGPASFMRLRNQRDPEPLWRVVSPQRAAQIDANPRGISVTDTATAPPIEPFTDGKAAFAAGLLLPGWNTARRPHDGVVLLSDDTTGSWATVFPHDDGYRIYHEGPRRLWDDLHTANRWWIDAGRPDSSRFGITVTPTGQTYWLDHPSSPLPAIGEPASRI